MVVVFNNDKPQEWSEFLTHTMEKLAEHNAQKIAVTAILDDDSTFTGYFMCDARDKAVFADAIYTDSIYDKIRANRDYLLSDELPESEE